MAMSAAKASPLAGGGAGAAEVEVDEAAAEEKEEEELAGGAPQPGNPLATAVPELGTEVPAVAATPGGDCPADGGATIEADFFSVELLELLGVNLLAVGLLAAAAAKRASAAAAAEACTL